MCEFAEIYGDRQMAAPTAPQMSLFGPPTPPSPRHWQSQPIANPPPPRKWRRQVCRCCCCVAAVGTL